ncbi:MAG: hypothetical protein RL711_658 [Bacteroidota bacterium]|jgi:flagellar hook assembly protein FlgD
MKKFSTYLSPILKPFYLLILLVSSFNHATAQTVPLQDAAFVSTLKDLFPQVIDANNDLIIIQANLISGPISLHNKSLTDITGINYFVNITSLDVSNNNLKNIPNIDALTKLEQFNCNNNQLTTLPDLNNFNNLKYISCKNNKITSLPPLNNLTRLEQLLLSNNQLTTLPEIYTPSLIISLEADYNQLVSIPDLNSFSSLTTLNLSHNQLGFTALKPSSKHLSFGAFTFFPQDTIGTVQDIKLLKNQPLSFKTSIDTLYPNIHYVWYKNGVEYPNAVSNQINIASALLSDTGVYTCVVSISNSSDNFYGQNLYTQAYVVSDGCIKVKQLTYQIESADCKTGTTIKIEESFNLGTKGPYQYTLKNISTGALSTGTSPVFANLPKGNYDVNIIDNQNSCASFIGNAIKIEGVADCDTNIINPNVEGPNKGYYIANVGQAEIFNRQGKRVKTLSVPAVWDGTDQNGNLLDLGYYVIIINGNTKLYVTLLQ